MTARGSSLMAVLSLVAATAVAGLEVCARWRGFERAAGEIAPAWILAATVLLVWTSWICLALRHRPLPLQRGWWWALAATTLALGGGTQLAWASLAPLVILPAATVRDRGRATMGAVAIPLCLAAAAAAITPLFSAEMQRLVWSFFALVALFSRRRSSGACADLVAALPPCSLALVAALHATPGAPGTATSWILAGTLLCGLATWRAEDRLQGLCGGAWLVAVGVGSTGASSAAGLLFASATTATLAVALARRPAEDIAQGGSTRRRSLPVAHRTGSFAPFLFAAPLAGAWSAASAVHLAPGFLGGALVLLFTAVFSFALTRAHNQSFRAEARSAAPPVPAAPARGDLPLGQLDALLAATVLLTAAAVFGIGGPGRSPTVLLAVALSGGGWIAARRWDRLRPPRTRSWSSWRVRLTTLRPITPPRSLLPLPPLVQAAGSSATGALLELLAWIVVARSPLRLGVVLAGLLLALWWTVSAGGAG